MKKLQKRFKERRNTVGKYNQTCSCYCNAPFCSAIWKDRNDIEAKNNFQSKYDKAVYN